MTQQTEFTQGDVVAVAGADWLAYFADYWRDEWAEVSFQGHPIASRHTLDRIAHPCGDCLTRFQDGMPRTDRYCPACHTAAHWETVRARQPLVLVEEVPA